VSAEACRLRHWAPAREGRPADEARARKPASGRHLPDAGSFRGCGLAVV